MTPQQAEKVLSKMVNVCHFEPYLAKQYNQCVVELLLYGNNTFSLDLYLKLANSPMNSGYAAHKMAMQFCLENINVEAKVDYVPKPIEKYTHWAIDSDGLAFYYNFKPKFNSDEWVMSYNPSTNDCQKDDDFNSEMYRHQWQGNNWKNSLIEF